jgi:hypothetical protein
MFFSYASVFWSFRSCLDLIYQPYYLDVISCVIWDSLEWFLWHLVFWRFQLGEICEKQNEVNEFCGAFTICRLLDISCWPCWEYLFYLIGFGWCFVRMLGSLKMLLNSYIAFIRTIMVAGIWILFLFPVCLVKFWGFVAQVTCCFIGLLCFHWFSCEDW